MSLRLTPHITSFFDRATYSYSHVLSDPSSNVAAIIDPVCDYDPLADTVTTHGADQIIAHIQERQLQVAWVLETHIHADHLSAGPYLRAALGGELGISTRVAEVQKLLGKTLGMEPEFVPDGSQFDRLLGDGERLPLGELHIDVMHTPGHTPACTSFLCGNHAFVGDALFMPDFGTGRTDFPGGCARTLYQSIQRILQLPKTTTLHLCHDYGSDARPDYCSTTTVSEERERNVHLTQFPEENAFVEFRETRDAGLSLPGLFNAAVPYNLRGGKGCEQR